MIAHTMTERTRTVDVGPQSLVLREWGATDAPLVLYVHGAGDDAGQASPLAAALQDVCRVIAPDAPAAAPSEVVALLAGLLDELDVQAAALVGFSWGASICCHAAARHPSRVSAVVLLEGGHIDFQDLIDFDAAELPALGQGLVREPATSTYAALRESSVPLLLVTALRDEALTQLRIDPLARLREAVPQATIVRVTAPDHDILGSDDGTVVKIVRDWLLAQ
jgi:pimeloyl-ACP methyl ester carboxylesterase